MSHPCPSIPLELEREIFEIAATHHPETMPTLLLVAQRVLQWIEPLLYRTLVVGGRTLVLGRITARRLDPANLLHLQPAKWKHVQHLLALDSHSDLLPVLPLCVRFERLGLRSEDPSMLTALEAMPLALQHLAFIKCSTLDAIDPSRPLYRTLTHLDMFAGTEGRPLDFQFAQLPALAHLGMHGDRSASCPRLHVLVSKIWFWSSWNRMQAHQPIDVDLRFVMMFTQAGLHNSVQDWALGAQGGKDFWARAELFIDKRRRGEIIPPPPSPPSRFWIEESDQI
ncbi:hypothetical protein C8J57DRAFT_1368910 [Mycena rebaudengoi]|nr:hypothetical protein C8J57DRAFT_1368910 [Mycena rebaudengoi]